MFERVVVVGAGAAGLSASYAAVGRGSDVRLLDHSVGASCLGGGAVDGRPWEQVARATELLRVPPTTGPIPEAVQAFVRSLGLWRLPGAGRPRARLATAAGRVRITRGHDRSLLDLSRLPSGARILLPRVDRAEWDADSLAAALSDDAYARSRRLHFEAVDAKLLKLAGEDRIAPADLARRHDAPERLGWLTERLREMLARQREKQVDAVLLGPWLGAREPLGPALSAALGRPAGEVLSGPGSAAGLRFQAARQRLLADLGVELEPIRVTAVERPAGGGELRVTLGGDEGDLIADSVVLAVGGLAGGGIRYVPPEHAAKGDLPKSARVPFALSLEAPVTFQAHGRPVDIVSSIHGPLLDEIGWPTDADPGLLEAIGVACDGTTVTPGIFAAGAVIADQPRTLLQAVFSGLRAGAAAAGEPGVSSGRWG